MADEGTLADQLKEHPELKAQLDQLRAASDSGILATALKQDPDLSTNLKEGGMIDAEGKLDADILAALDKVGVAEAPATDAADSNEQDNSEATPEVSTEEDTDETTAPESTPDETSTTPSAAADTTSGTSQRTLANTGASVISLSGIAAVAAIVGGVIVLSRRKKI